MNITRNIKFNQLIYDVALRKKREREYEHTCQLEDICPLCGADVKYNSPVFKKCNSETCDYEYRVTGAL